MLRLFFAVLVLLVLNIGCAAPGYNQTPSEGYQSSISDLPPSFYDNDPALRDWFTAPYWNPDIGG